MRLIEKLRGWLRSGASPLRTYEPWIVRRLFTRMSFCEISHEKRRIDVGGDSVLPADDFNRSLGSRIP